MTDQNNMPDSTLQTLFKILEEIEGKLHVDKNVSADIDDDEPAKIGY